MPGSDAALALTGQSAYCTYCLQDSVSPTVRSKHENISVEAVVHTEGILMCEKYLSPFEHISQTKHLQIDFRIQTRAFFSGAMLCCPDRPLSSWQHVHYKSTPREHGPFMTLFPKRTARLLISHPLCEGQLGEIAETYRRFYTSSACFSLPVGSGRDASVCRTLWELGACQESNPTAKLPLPIVSREPLGHPCEGCWPPLATLFSWSKSLGGRNPWRTPAWRHPGP